MARTLFSQARPRTPGRGEDRSLRPTRANLVIADWGPTAELLIFPVGERVCRGAEFRYRGTTWIVTGRRRDSRLSVAEPVDH